MSLSWTKRKIYTPTRRFLGEVQFLTIVSPQNIYQNVISFSKACPLFEAKTIKYHPDLICTPGLVQAISVSQKVWPDRFCMSIIFPRFSTPIINRCWVVYRPWPRVALIFFPVFSIFRICCIEKWNEKWAAKDKDPKFFILLIFWSSELSEAVKCLDNSSPTTQYQSNPAISSSINIPHASLHVKTFGTKVKFRHMQRRGGGGRL